jgi:hypothetical protein
VPIILGAREPRRIHERRPWSSRLLEKREIRMRRDHRLPGF